MAHSSLRTRILVMTALPAFLAALVIGGYTLVHRMVEVRADTAHRRARHATTWRRWSSRGTPAGSWRTASTSWRSRRSSGTTGSS